MTFELTMTLVILAAGLGSRYGGIKQIAAVGPNGEAIIDYSIFDAIQAGFDKVVFVVNPKIEAEFKELFEPKLKNRIQTAYAIQDLKDIPEGFPVHSERKKPWGTGHALLSVKDQVSGPFVSINADDFYSRNAFVAMHSFLSGIDPASHQYAMVAYNLEDTLSDHGSVSRAVCQIQNDLLQTSVERTSISKQKDSIAYQENGQQYPLQGDAIVSMNIWGFTPAFFSKLEDAFNNFLEGHSSDLKSEFFIPNVVNNGIENGTLSVNILRTKVQWFGMTYQNDLPKARNKIRQLIQEGVYPESLWA